MRVKEILSQKSPGVLTVSPEQTIQQACEMLAKYNIGALLVVDSNDTPVGILSERDIVRVLARSGSESVNHRVEDVMTKREKLIIALPEDEVEQLSHVMTAQRIRHLPIMDGDQLVGVISIGDVVKAQLTHLEAEARNLMQYITGGYA
jgi:CBS domain-containing protein